MTVSTAYAEKVTLRSIDGSISMNGELLSFDGEYYVLKVMLGQFEIAVADVTCEGEFCPELMNSDFRLTGSSTLAQVLIPSLFQEFAGGYGLSLTLGDPTFMGAMPVQRYLFSTPEGEAFADVEVHSLASNMAFNSLLGGASEIALSSRAITASELDTFAAAGLGDLSDENFQVVAALDGLIVIVPPENEVRALTMQELSQIFSGQISNWVQLGGADAPINVYRRDEASGSASDFSAVVLDPLGATFSTSSTAFTDDISLVRAVKDDPNGIGFTSFAYQQNTRVVLLRGTCGFISMPSEFTVKTGEYPLARRVYLYTTNRMFGAIPVEKAEKALGFLAFVKNDQGQNAAEVSGFVSQSISALPIEVKGQRLINTMLAGQGDVGFGEIRRMISELSGAIRLSSTFRFKTNVVELAAQARGDIPRLAAYLQNNDFAGREVLIAGYSDAAGGASQNAALSQRRAQQVLDELTAELGDEAANYTFVVKGFGEVSPQGCNDSLSGRAVNRRVEVWVRVAT
ncbi:MAG: phosphate ABC transporter substrate-binding/OmpA family protein [Paracoccaceae bacterium]